MSHLRCRAVGLGLLLLPFGRLAAQVPDSTAADSLRRDTTTVTTLQEIEVVGSIAPTAGPAVGSGIPARISTVTGRQIDAWEPRLLADALATQPGISLYDDLGSAYKLNLSTRGFNVGPVVGLPPGVSVFLDGVRQNEPDAAEVNFDLLPMEHVNRVELLSGSGSLLGANSLGGAINLVTRRGEGPVSGELELSGGSYGAGSAEGSVSGATTSRMDYYVAGGYEREDGWRQATGAHNYNGFVNLGRRGERRGLTWQAFGAKSRAKTAGSLPESLFDRSPETNFTVGDFEDLDLLQSTVTGYAPVGPGKGSFTAYVRRSSAERFNVNQAPDDNVRSLTTNGTVGANTDWRWTRAAGAGQLSIRTGLDASANRVHIRLFTEDPVASSNRTLTTDVRSPSWDVAGYALGDYRVGRVTLSGGFRYDYIRIPFENQLDPAADTSSSFSRLSPRAGVSVDLGGGASSYASVGQSFRAPAVLELACADETAACPLPFALGDDPPLEPVVGTTLEVGAQLVRGPAILSASLYRTAVRDDISFIQSENAVFEGFFANIGRTRREGAELSVQVLPSEAVSLYANYSFTLATYRDPAEIFSIRADDAFADSPLAGANAVAVGNQLPTVPKHQVKAGGLVRLRGGFDAGLDFRYTGQQWLRGDEANETSPLGGYVTVGARAGWERGPWEVSVVGTNLFDSHRAVFGTFNENRQTGELERFLTPLGARAVKLVVRRSFGGSSEHD
ncbi:MAG TPA: TonB-dependent receptor [Gemmatimonadales bacterium]|nr:TonB-dependent receptor [Gemmatimonadales bacterium]